MSESSERPSRLELWGGAECTVNRVGNRYLDQTERTGHGSRPGDLDLFAGLGISAIRYPVLWERVAPHGPERAGWNWWWTDERLARLQELGIRPIAGLVHHGNGPPYTSLLDPVFPEKLAVYAGAVAERYPWIDRYTPINEPLTTARFSGLYGLWYPHGRDVETFTRLLLTQCRAVVLSMRAIHTVNPAAQLVQTDDVSKIFSTRLLRDQARLENWRRWLSFDLLCGRVDRHHPLWSFLRTAGKAREAELDWFLEHPCPPDIIGIDHYLSSERYLDDRLELYPAHSHGGNGRQAYADVLGVRVRAEGLAGPATLLAEAWERYHLPMALTEVHNGCTREEQLRWFHEVWRTAQGLHDGGIDVRAVTAWFLLGGYDWDALVTCDAGRYEPGVFDLRGPRPRPTAMVALLRDVAAGRRPEHPLLEVPGWWRRPDRLIHGHSVSDAGKRAPCLPLPSINDRYPQVRPLVIIGAAGTLGRAFGRLCEERGIPYRRLTRQQMDIADPHSVAKALDEQRPWAVVNAAGYASVDGAERNALRCYRDNAEGPAVLAAACAERGLPFLTFSSDLVFDGAQSIPYLEGDAVAPLNVYGISKGEAEARVLALLPSALVVRTSALFGPWDERNVLTRTLQAVAQGRTVVAADDQVLSPTYVPDLVHTSLDLLIDGESGLWHLANQGAITWADLARTAARAAHLDADRVVGSSTRGNNPRRAARPAYSVLGSERGQLLSTLDDALVTYLDARGSAWIENRQGAARIS